MNSLSKKIEIITPSTEDHLNGILRLNHKMLGHGIEWPLTKKDLEQLLNKSHSEIAIIDTSIIGYILSFDLDAPTKYPKEIVELFKNKVSPEIQKKIQVSIGQICIAPEYQGIGIGTKLHKELIQQNTDYDLRIIDIDTYNRPSQKIPLAFGGFSISQWKQKYEMLGIPLKTIPKNIITALESTTKTQ